MAPKKQEIERVPSELAQIPGVREPREGFENVERKDLIVPRIRVCHAQSPQRLKKSDSYMADLREGQMFNTMSRVIYGAKIRVVVVHFFRTRIKFHSKKLGEGIDCRADDGKNGQGDPGGVCMRCALSMWQGKEPPLCTEYYNFVVVVMPEKGFPSIDDMAVMSFKSTGTTTAKEWITRMNMLVDERRSPMPIFGGVHDITVSEQSDENNTWFGFNPQPAGRTTPEQREFARMMYLMVSDADKSGKLKPQEDVEEREPGDDDEPPPAKRSRSKAPF